MLSMNKVSIVIVFISNYNVVKIKEVSWNKFWMSDLTVQLLEDVIRSDSKREYFYVCVSAKCKTSISYSKCWKYFGTFSLHGLNLIGIIKGSI